MLVRRVVDAAPCGPFILRLGDGVPVFCPPSCSQPVVWPVVLLLLCDLVCVPPQVLDGFFELEQSDAMADIYVWLRYSATRQLTWQRNYNTQPRILSAAQVCWGDGL